MGVWLNQAPLSSVDLVLQLLPSKRPPITRPEIVVTNAVFLSSIYVAGQKRASIIPIFPFSPADIFFLYLSLWWTWTYILVLERVEYYIACTHICHTHDKFTSSRPLPFPRLPSSYSVSYFLSQHKLHEWLKFCVTQPLSTQPSIQADPVIRKFRTKEWNDLRKGRINHCQDSTLPDWFACEIRLNIYLLRSQSRILHLLISMADCG